MSVCSWDNCFRQTDRVRGAELKGQLRLVTIAWGFGSLFLGAISGTAIPELANLVGATPFFFGLLAAGPFVASLIQLPVSWLVERTLRRKWLFIGTVGAHRILWLLIGIVPFLLPRSSEWRDLRLGLLFGVMFVSWVLGSAGGPTWTGWMADLIPAKIRGRYWAYRRKVGLVNQTIAALAAGWFIDLASRSSLGMEGGLAIVFAFAAVCGAIDCLLFMFIPEIPKKPAAVTPTWRNLLREPLRDRPFRRFMYFSALLTFASAGLIGYYLQRNLREIVLMNNWMVNFALVISPSAGWYLTVGAWGRARDRWGNRPILILATAAIVPGPLLWCLVGPQAQWLALLIPVYGGIVWAGIEMAQSNVLLSLAENGKISSYQAVFAIVSAIGGIVGPLIAGALAQVLQGWHVEIASMRFVSYHLLFVLAAGVQLLTLPLAMRIEEPTARSTRDLLRLLWGNAFAMTRAYVNTPWRVANVGIRAAYRKYGRNGQKCPAPQPGRALVTGEWNAATQRARRVTV